MSRWVRGTQWGKSRRIAIIAFSTRTLLARCEWHRWFILTFSLGGLYIFSAEGQLTFCFEFFTFFSCTLAHLHRANSPPLAGACGLFSRGGEHFPFKNVCITNFFQLNMFENIFSSKMFVSENIFPSKMFVLENIFSSKMLYLKIFAIWKISLHDAAWYAF